MNSDKKHFLQLDEEGYLSLQRQLAPLCKYWRNGIVTLHTLPREVPTLCNYLSLVRDCATLYLGNVIPLMSFDRLWAAYEPFMDNVYNVSVSPPISSDLGIVVRWLLSANAPRRMSRFLTVRSGSQESYRLCMLLYQGFLDLCRPLPCNVNVIIWNEWTKWPISTRASLELYSITTKPTKPLLSDHNSFEFILYGPYGIHGTYPGATMLRISPRTK